MMPNKRMNLMIFAVAALIALTSVCFASSAEITRPLNNELKELMERRKSIILLRTLINELDSNLARVYKRGCDINLPGFDCDSMETAYSGGGDNSGWFADSGAAASSQKRGGGGCINADGSSCDTAQIAQEVSNRRPWMNGPGRRKRHSGGQASTSARLSSSVDHPIPNSAASNQ